MAKVGTLIWSADIGVIGVFWYKPWWRLIRTWAGFYNINHWMCNNLLISTTATFRDRHACCRPSLLAQSSRRLPLIGSFWRKNWGRDCHVLKQTIACYIGRSPNEGTLEHVKYTGERVVAGRNSHYFYYKIGYKQYAFPKVLHNIFQFNRHVLWQTTCGYVRLLLRQSPS